MAYTPVPTVSTGDLWTAADHNTYIKDNFAAGVPAIITAKGDLVVGSGSQSAGILSVGDDYNLLTTLSSEALGLKWVPLSQILQFDKKQALSTDTTSTDWVDISESVLSMTLNRTSTIIAIAVGTGRASSGNTLYVRLVIDGVAGEEILLGTTAAVDLNTPTMLSFYRSGVAAGSRTIKLQYKSSAGGQVNFYNGTLVAFAIPTA